MTSNGNGNGNGGNGDAGAFDPDLPLPRWAPPDVTWEQLIANLRVWLKPDDNWFTDHDLQMLLNASPSFLHAVRLGWLSKIRFYADPNRLVRGQIGNETLQFPDPDALIRWARDILKDLDEMMGLGHSRVFSYRRPAAQVWGVTPYELSPPPFVYWPGNLAQPEPWDITRFPPQVWIDRTPWPHT